MFCKCLGRKANKILQVSKKTMIVIYLELFTQKKKTNSFIPNGPLRKVIKLAHYSSLHPSPRTHSHVCRNPAQFNYHCSAN